MRFNDDEPIVCDECNDIIFAPSEYYRFNNGNYCSKKCLGEAMIEEHWNEVSEEQLLSKEDKESIWGDMEYDRMKGEGLI